MAELCRIYEVSRESGYKWLRRSQVEGEAGLEDRSRAAVRHPNQTKPSTEQQLLALRQRHATWGARKLRAYLQQKQPRLVLPAASTIGALLKREGLTVPRRQLRKTPPYTQPFQQAVEPNQLWCADFKGWFLTLDRQRIDPLTISDTASRYLLPGSGKSQHRTRARHLPGGVPAVWSAEGHSHRQRATLCFQSHCRTFSSSTLLDEAGHHPGADRPRSSRTERSP
jgi:transposase